MSSDNFSFNANASNQSQINQGKSVSVVMNNNSTGGSVQFYEALRQALPQEAQPVVAELEQLAAQEPAMAIADQSSEECVAFEEQKKSALDRLKEFLPMIAKGGLAFGSGYMRSYVQTSPLAAGIVAAFDAIQSA